MQDERIYTSHLTSIRKTPLYFSSDPISSKRATSLPIYGQPYPHVGPGELARSGTLRLTDHMPRRCLGPRRLGMSLDLGLGYENDSESEDRTAVTVRAACIPRVYSLADARAVTLPPYHSPPVRTKLSCIASRNGH
jgi:hypothetical protein